MSISNKDFETVRQRFIEPYIKIERQSAIVLSKQAQEFAASMKEDGTWADIDYQNSSTTYWLPMKHIERLIVMAQAYLIPNQPRHLDHTLKNTMLRGFDAWTRLELECPNWWFNCIGAPRRLGVFLLLIQDYLSDEQRAAGLKQLLFWESWSNATGQNLAWGVQVQVMAGCLEKSHNRVEQAYNRLNNEIAVFDDGEGIQADRSFHQHGRLLYNGGYGRNFTVDVPNLAYLVRGTAFELPREKISLLSSYFLDGQQWMIRGDTFDHGTVGREITRAGHSARALGPACLEMAEVDNHRKDEYLDFEKRLKAEKPDPAVALNGNRHFWKGDLMTHHRLDYYASVRMTSQRLKRSEYVNTEGLRSHHLADGVTYIMRSGREYHDIFPVWDWRRLPGITVEYSNEPYDPNQVTKTGETSFAGGVSDGKYGMAAIDFLRGSLSAHKAWFFFDREIVCLGSGITDGSNHPVITSLNQCLLNGAVTIEDNKGQRTLPKGRHTLTNLRWAYHDGVGYVFPKPVSANLHCDEQTGSWSLIGAGSAAQVALDVFSLYLEHGAKPVDASYAYIISPELHLDEMPQYTKSTGIEILSNTTSLQAAYRPDIQLTGAAFYSPGSVQIGKTKVAVDRPCLMLWREEGDTVYLTFSNPENLPLVVQADISLRFQSEEGAWDAAAKVFRLRVELPDGPNAGKSVTKKLKRLH